MSDTVEVDELRSAAEPAAVDSTRDRAERFRIRLFIVVAVLLGAVVVGAALVWHAVASITLGAVTLQYDTQPILCDGAVVESRPSAESEEFAQPSVVMTEGMTCRLRIQVINDSAMEVNLEAVTLQGLAPGNGLELEVQSVNPNAQHGESEEGDYRFPLPGGFPIAAGTIQTVEAVLTYDGGAALGACSANAWRIPVITVAAAGQSRIIESPPHSDIWFSSGSREQCGQ